MSDLEIFILAIVQGITEFLPISSSAHLILLPHIMGGEDQGPAIDIALHFGSLMAALVAFRSEIFHMIFNTYQGSEKVEIDWRLFGQLLLASLPITITALTLSAFNLEPSRDPIIIAWASIGFAIVLYLADLCDTKIKHFRDLNWAFVGFIGLAQCLALIPGTSRSGITITASRLCGLEREDAARFSMMLGIPAILGASIFLFLDFYQEIDISILSPTIIGSAITSFFATWLAIWGLLRLLRSSTFTPFVLYRIFLGFAIIAMNELGLLSR